MCVCVCVYIYVCIYNLLANYQRSFVCTRSYGFKYCYLILLILFNINHSLTHS